MVAGACEGGHDDHRWGAADAGRHFTTSITLVIDSLPTSSSLAGRPRPRPDVASAKNAAIRKKLIASLESSDPRSWLAWKEALRAADEEGHFIRTSGRFPLCGRGDVNTYSVFAEHNVSILSPRGRAGFIVPTGMVTDEGTSLFLRNVVDGRRLVNVFDFENTAASAFFPGVGNRRFRFCLVTVAGSQQSANDEPEFVFYADRVSQIREAERRIRLSPADFELFNPATRTCPIFRSSLDADLARRLYRRLPTVRSPQGNPWPVRFATAFHMSGDSSLFFDVDQCLADGYTPSSGNHMVKGDAKRLPLYEAKMMSIYDHRYGDYRDRPDGSENTSLPVVPDAKLADIGYEPFPRYWIDSAHVDDFFNRMRWKETWVLGWRDIARSGDERTAIFSVLPRTAFGHTLPLCLFEAASGELPQFIDGFHAYCSSLIFDYVTRLKNGGTHLTFSLVDQLPVLTPHAFEEAPEFLRGTSVGSFVRPRLLELVYSSESVAGYARRLGYTGRPFSWDRDRRDVLRAELDAMFFALLGFERNEVEYVLDSFKRLALNEQASVGEYRTRKLVLRSYDALRSGQVLR